MIILDRSGRDLARRRPPRLWRPRAALLALALAALVAGAPPALQSATPPARTLLERAAPPAGAFGYVAQL